jgi:hypothetical protein
MKGLTACETALELLLRYHLWPVAIKPREKAPIGESWGSTRPTERSIRETYKRFPEAGVGLLLGPEAGIIDIECDGPEGEDSLAKLLGGEILLTLSWSSARGPHQVFRYDGRLAKYGKSIIKLLELPDLEIRIGGHEKQLQSNCPPTRGNDGKPREWNETLLVADLPEAAILFLDAAVAASKHEPRIVVPNTSLIVTSARSAYATRALDDECQAVALAPDGEQNETLNKASFKLGQLVSAGALDHSEVERRLMDAATGYIRKDGETQARKTVQSGLNAGGNQPRNLSHVEATCNGRHDPGRGEQPTDPPPWPPLRLSEPPRALPFPVDVFPACLQDYCIELADAKLAPVDFVGLSMVVAAGAAIGQSVNVKVKSDWSEPPLLNGILVAAPGKTKSPVVRAVVKPLTDIDRRLREESSLARDKWKEGKRAHDKDPDNEPPPGPEPPQLRAIVKDITRESLVIILADNPRGVLCDPDEASGWAASFNEYKGKGGSDRQFWLSVWSSAPISVDRKGGRESIYVPFPYVSVLGSLPPDMLTSLRDVRGRNDGFLDRILFSYPDSFPSQRWTERELSTEAENNWSGAINRLFAQAMRIRDDRLMPQQASFSPEGKAAWVAWFDCHADEMEDPNFPERQAGAWSKLRAHAARFALILSRLRLACDPCPRTAGWGGIFVTDQAESTTPPIIAADVQGAVRLVDYFKSHLSRVTHRLAAGIGNADAKAVVDWLRRTRRDTFREADIGKDLRRFRDHLNDLAAALNALRALGAIRPRAETLDPSKPGPKPSPAYDVHPDLLGAPEITSNTTILDGGAASTSNCGNRGNSRRDQENETAGDREVFEL